MPELSTKPYLLRAIYEWCVDSGYTPYIAVRVDARSRVPMEFVRNGEIVLNISFGATSNLKMESEFINFSARFGGVSRQISVAVESVIAIYAHENGQGMAFEPQEAQADQKATSQDVSAEQTAADSAKNGPTLASVPAVAEKSQDTAEKDAVAISDPAKKSGKPVLTRIK
ncbi:ClpXP protease specificity-enhancing factor [Herminiimonas sp. CN]|uniref:ClpXP protease specificity-enhancing factor n=1 Tax=Herminiimonas sp. CN TaxID=1349818 RepID=UPI0004731365|nr:ClpXP protease specificity-enhancing factor [Herminiimonas sp. CN]